MLTAELIRANEALKDLPDEKVQAFEKLANNVFKEQIDQNSGVMHRRWEEDIKEIYGVEKPDGKMKSHEYFKWAAKKAQEDYEKKLAEVAGSGAGAGEELEKLKRQLSEAQEQLKSGALKGSELLKQDIEGYKKRIQDYEGLVDELKKKSANDRKELETKIQEKERQALLLEVGFEKAQSLMGVEFDPLVDESIRQTFVDTKWNELLKRYTPERTTNEAGQMVTQWRDKEGKLVRSTANNMEPATTKDLLMQEITPILRKGRTQTGNGTNGGQNAGNGDFLDLRGAKTQVEADEAIVNFLVSQGVQKGTVEFANRQASIRAENGVQKLPLR